MSYMRCSAEDWLCGYQGEVNLLFGQTVSGGECRDKGGDKHDRERWPLWADRSETSQLPCEHCGSRTAERRQHWQRIQQRTAEPDGPPDHARLLAQLLARRGAVVPRLRQRLVRVLHVEPPCAQRHHQLSANCFVQLLSVQCIHACTLPTARGHA